MDVVLQRYPCESGFIFHLILGRFHIMLHTAFPRDLSSNIFDLFCSHSTKDKLHIGY